MEDNIQNIVEIPQVIETTEDPLRGFQYYWCVNCGYAGNFGRRRIRGQNCEKCNYDGLTPYELEEIMEDEHQKHRFRNHIDEISIVVGS